MSDASTNPQTGANFRDFVSTIRKHWRSALPSVTPLTKPLPPYLAKSSSFYAGVTAQSMHVFISFQSHSKAWHTGEFTVNLIVSPSLESPNNAGGDLPSEDWSQLSEGSYRIGILLRRKDKWWHLLPKPPAGFFRIGRSTMIESMVPTDRVSKFKDSWYASDYSNSQAVVEEAVRDVTADVIQVLQRLGLVKG